MADTKDKPKTRAARIITPLGFFAYLKAHEPAPLDAKYDKGCFVATLVAPKDDPQWKEIKRLQLAVARAKWGNDLKWGTFLYHIGDGDEKYAEEVAKLEEKAKEAKDAPSKKAIMDKAKHWEKWKGCSFIKAKQKAEYSKPGIIGADKAPLPEGETLEGGDFGRMTIIPFAYEMANEEIVNGKVKKTKKRGVSFRLGNMQKQGTGERFKGSQVNAADEFDEVTPLSIHDAELDLMDGDASAAAVNTGSDDVGSEDEAFDDVD